MALYTMTLYDWLQNGFELPEIFSEIPTLPESEMTFAELFVYHFSEWEIGFETAESFERKLTQHANMIIPLYIKKIETIENEYSNIFKNETVRRSYLNNIVISTLDDDTGNSAESLEIKNPTETINAIKQFQEKINSVYMSLLDEFQSMFVGLC